MNLITDYVKYLSLTKSEESVKGYQSNVSVFCNYMKEKEFEINKTNAKKIQVTHIYNFMYYLKDTNAAAAIRRKLCALTNFFTYLVKIKVINKNVMFELDKDDKPKIPKRKAKYLNIEQCKKLLESVSPRNAVRDKTIILLILNTGMRLSEVVDLNIDIVGKEVTQIIGKGNKERTMYMSEQINFLLQEYMKVRANVKGENALFLSERKSRMDKTSIQSMVRIAMEKSGVNPQGDSDMLVHLLRHSFATNSFQNGMDLRTLQEILGHASLSTTQIYVQVDEKQMIKQANNSIMNSIIS